MAEGVRIECNIKLSSRNRTHLVHPRIYHAYSIWASSARLKDGALALLNRAENQHGRLEPRLLSLRLLAAMLEGSGEAADGGALVTARTCRGWCCVDRIVLDRMILLSR